MTQTTTRHFAADDVLWLIARGEEPERACRRVGTSMDAVQQALRRAGRHEDWARIVAAKPCSLRSQLK